ncbi:MAG TPA: sterol desaturase family protein [Polyangiaceae bacterium]
MTLGEIAAAVDLKGIASVAAVFLPLQLALPHRREQKIFRKQWVSDFSYLLFNGFFISFGIAVLTTFALPYLKALLPLGVLDFVGRRHFVWQVLAAFVISDIGYYVAHRLFHAVPFLWRFHAVHHSIEELDWLAAHRVHFVDQTVTMAMSSLPVLVLGFSPEALAAFGFIHLMQAHLVHSNTRVHFGPLRWVFCSPLFHHWHHANEPAAWDKNFSARLVVLDRIFGTFYMPDHMPARYGTNDPVPTIYPLQLVWPLTRQARAPRPPEPMPEIAPVPDQPVSPANSI